MPTNVLEKDTPRGKGPKAFFESKHPDNKNSDDSPTKMGEYMNEADLATKEEEALWDAANEAMTEKEGSLRW